MARFSQNDHNIVFSSDDGDRRRRSTPPSTDPDPTTDGVVRVRRETKGRKGKTVTTVSGVPLDRSALAALTKELKRRCGTGGALKDGVIEMQGDHRDTVVDVLEKRGFLVKLAGG